MQMVIAAAIRPELASDPHAIDTFRALVARLKAPTEEILFWVSSPDAKRFWRLSDARDPHLLDELLLQVEDEIEVRIEPVNDIFVSFPAAVGEWGARPDEELGDLMA